MSRFSHVSDKGIRAFLETENLQADFNLLANQLDAALKHLENDNKGKHVPFEILEKRDIAYDDACQYFALRNINGVHRSLQKFWWV